jgi:O-antigen ligase
MLRINRSNLLIGNNLGVIILVVLSVFITVLFINHLFVGIAVIVISLLILLCDERFLVGLIIVTLFSVVSGFGSTLRLFVHITNFSLLGFLFIRHYGFNFTEYPKIPKPLLYFIGMYYFSMLISAAFSNYFSAGLFLIGRQTVFFIVAYIFYSLIIDIEYVKTIIISLVIVSVFVALSAVYDVSQSGIDLFKLTFGSRYRATSFIGNTDASTAFFILTLPIISVFVFLKELKSIRGILLFLIVVITLGLFLIISRSAILSISASLSILLYHVRKMLFLKLILIGSVLLLIILLIGPINEILFLFLRLESGLSQRSYFWELAYNIIIDNPILGIGPGSYKYLEFNYVPVLMNSWVGRIMVDLSRVVDGANVSHNMYLKFMSDMGIPGLLSILYLFGLFIHISISTINKVIKGNKVLYLLILVISTVLGSMFIRCIFDDIGILNYGIIVTDLPFWLLFGILIFFYQKPEEYFVKTDFNLT